MCVCRWVNHRSLGEGRGPTSHGRDELKGPLIKLRVTDVMASTQTASRLWKSHPTESTVKQLGHHFHPARLIPHSCPLKSFSIHLLFPSSLSCTSSNDQLEPQFTAEVNIECLSQSQSFFFSDPLHDSIHALSVLFCFVLFCFVLFYFVWFGLWFGLLCFAFLCYALLQLDFSLVWFSVG